MTGAACPLVSDEGLVCTLGANHLGDMHKDQSDPSTEVQWQKPRAQQEITLGQLVADVDDRVRSRAAALLAQAPALGHSATFTIVDEVPESVSAEAGTDLTNLVAPVQPPGVFGDALRKFFPVRRDSRGRAGRGS